MGVGRKEEFPYWADLSMTGFRMGPMTSNSCVCPSAGPARLEMRTTDQWKVASFDIEWVACNDGRWFGKNRLLVAIGQWEATRMKTGDETSQRGSLGQDAPFGGALLLEMNDELLPVVIQRTQHKSAAWWIKSSYASWLPIGRYKSQCQGLDENRHCLTFAEDATFPPFSVVATFKLCSGLRFLTVEQSSEKEPSSRLRFKGSRQLQLSWWTVSYAWSDCCLFFCLVTVKREKRYECTITGRDRWHRWLWKVLETCESLWHQLVRFVRLAFSIYTLQPTLIKSCSATRLAANSISISRLSSLVSRLLSLPLESHWITFAARLIANLNLLAMSSSFLSVPLNAIDWQSSKKRQTLQSLSLKRPQTMTLDSSLRYDSHPNQFHWKS